MVSFLEDPPKVPTPLSVIDPARERGICRTTLGLHASSCPVSGIRSYIHVSVTVRQVQHAVYTTSYSLLVPGMRKLPRSDLC